MIAHPPCTYLTISGNRWFAVERYGEKAVQRIKDRDEGAAFFMEFVNADCDHIAIENPIGWMNTHYRKPDQIIHPYYFGDPVSKATCLWLKELPKLVPTKMVEPEWHTSPSGARFSGPLWQVIDENGKSVGWDDPRTARERSKTYPGIAKAIAEQWSDYLEDGLVPIGTQFSFW